MEYVEAIFTIEPVDPGRDIMIAHLAEMGFESFVETQSGFKAYIPSVSYREINVVEVVEAYSGIFSCQYEKMLIEEENWNKVWESSYNPVLISDTVYIHATFHPARTDVRFNVLIDPKMSFGTAHHATTKLMVRQLLELNLAEKNVLDMGCGTGILAILAEFLGAESVRAVDNDPNAVRNAKENAEKNKCGRITVQLGDVSDVNQQYNVILANINKNILIAGMPYFADGLTDQGLIFFSGFYEEDLEDIKKSAGENQLTFKGFETEDNWVAAWFVKNN